VKSLPNGRLGWAALAAVIAAIAGTGSALADYPQDSVAVYTGCLQINGTGGGQIASVAISPTTPLKPCNSNQTLIHFSGGTITQVTAGPGLTGGGSNGYVTLGLDSKYTLPQQGCSTGSIVKWNGSAWVCGDDQTYTNGTGLDLSGNTFSINSGFQLPRSCSSGQLVKSNGSNTWACEDAPNGGNFVLSGQSCGAGQFVTGSDGSGNTTCGNDQTYTGTDFATSGQDCPSGQFANGIDDSGKLKCTTPSSSGGDAWSSFVSSFTIPGSTYQSVTHVDLPNTGEYFVTADFKNSDSAFTDCLLSGVLNSFNDFVNLGFTSLQGIATGGTVTLLCGNDPLGLSHPVGTLSHVSLIAIQVGAVH